MTAAMALWVALYADPSGPRTAKVLVTPLKGPGPLNCSVSHLMQIRRLNPADAEAFRTLRLSGLQEATSAFGSSYEEEVSFPESVTESRLAQKPDSGLFGECSEHHSDQALRVSGVQGVWLRALRASCRRCPT